MISHRIVDLSTSTEPVNCSYCNKQINPNEQAIKHIAVPRLNQKGQPIPPSFTCKHSFHLSCQIRLWANKVDRIYLTTDNKDQSTGNKDQSIRYIKGFYCKKPYKIPSLLFRKIQPLLLRERNTFQYCLLHLFIGSIMAITFSGSFLFFRSKVKQLSVSKITRRTFLVLSGSTSSGLSYFTAQKIYRLSLDFLVKD